MKMNIRTAIILITLIGIILGLLWHEHKRTSPTQLDKLLTTDQSVSNDDFTFYYPGGFTKDDSTSAEILQVHTQFIARYQEKSTEERRYYLNFIKLKKILEPLDISSEEKCRSLAEGREVFFYKYTFDLYKKVSSCVIETHHWASETHFAHTRRYFYQSNNNQDTYLITTEDVDDGKEELLWQAAEKFELKD